MANTLNVGNGDWATKENSLLGYNSENGNYKPLPFDFTRASSATFVNKSGLIETAASGVPRIDFSNDANGALLLEPQSTNLVTYSSDFSQWSGSGYITSNYAISPDGTQNASRCLFTGANQVLSKTSTLSTGVSCSATFYVKGVSGETIRLAAGGADTTHLLNGSWQRIETNSTSINSTIVLNTFGGATARDLLIYGAQLEQGSYATSLINTQGSAVTRVADVCSQTVPSGIIGQTEGTVFLDSKMALQNISNYQLFSINNGGNSDRIRVLTATGNRLRFIYQLNGGVVAYTFYNPTDYSDLTSLKIAFTYKSGDIKVYINGVLADSSTNTFTIAETLTNIDIASSAGGYNQMLFNDIKLYNTALTDAELAALTS